MAKVLVTGFGPYGTTPTNPAQLVAEALDGRALDRNLGAPSMALETSVAGVLAGVQAAIEADTDVREPVRSRFQI